MLYSSRENVDENVGNFLDITFLRTRNETRIPNSLEIYIYIWQEESIAFSSFEPPPLFLILYWNLVLRNVAIPLEITEILSPFCRRERTRWREGFLLKFKNGTTNVLLSFVIDGRASVNGRKRGEISRYNFVEIGSSEIYIYIYIYLNLERRDKTFRVAEFSSCLKFFELKRD